MTRQERAERGSALPQSSIRSKAASEAKHLQTQSIGRPVVPSPLGTLSAPTRRSTRLARNDLIEPLTESVGSMSQVFTFVVSFVALSVLLAATGMLARGEVMVLKATKKPG